MSHWTPNDVAHENVVKAEKRKKLHDLREKGIDPYPHVYERNSITLDVAKKYEHLKSGEKDETFTFKLAGRVMTKRPMGKAAFFNIQDQSGNLQIYLRLEELSEKARIAFEHVDLGDIVGIEGIPFRTQKGELSLHAKNFTMLSKSLEPLPDKFAGLADIEIKYRHRHLDLITDQDSRNVFITRSKILKEIRHFLDERGFLEMETPVLQPIYGGAAAHPFKTHHRALDMELFLKISPELYLKRLIVGGFEKVYDMNRNFRNEGIDRSHNPEFTMIEWYEAYTDYVYQMKQFEEMVSSIAKKITGSTKVTYGEHEIDFTTPWRRLTMYDAIKQYGKVDVSVLTEQELFAVLKKHGSETEKPEPHGNMVAELFELVAEHHLIQPTFIIDHPVEISPLTKTHRFHHQLVERFEVFFAGMEIGNSYTELNDPEEQRKRLKDQESQRLFDEEAHPMDEDFLHAIETGMPPTGGVGLGVERVVMVLTNSPSIRDIILFPTMKPHKN